MASPLPFCVARGTGHVSFRDDQRLISQGLEEKREEASCAQREEPAVSASCESPRAGGCLLVQSQWEVLSNHDR